MPWNSSGLEEEVWVGSGIPYLHFYYALLLDHISLLPICHGGGLSWWTDVAV